MDINKNKLHYSGCVFSGGLRLIPAVGGGGVLAVVLTWVSPGAEGQGDGLVLCVASTLLTLQNNFQRAPSAPSGGKGLSGGYTALAGRLQPADSGQSGRAVAPQAVGIQCPSVGIDEWAFINRGDGVGTRTPPPHSSPCRSTRTSNLWTSSKGTWACGSFSAEERSEPPARTVASCPWPRLLPVPSLPLAEACRYPQPAFSS